MSGYRITLAILYVLVLLTAIALVYVKHKSRDLFVGLQQAEKLQRTLEKKGVELMLEQSALLSHGKVERVARKKLKMRLPENKQILIIE